MHIHIYRRYVHSYVSVCQDMLHMFPLSTFDFYWLAMTKQQAHGAIPSCFLSRLLFLLCQRRLDLETAGHARKTAIILMSRCCT